MSQPELTEETKNEWVLFCETDPTMEQASDWCQLKAAELGWNYFDFCLTMFFVQKPGFCERASGGCGGRGTDLN